MKILTISCFLALLLFLTTTLAQDLPWQDGRAIITIHRSNLFNGVQEAWVRHYSSGLVPGKDYATAIAIDQSGNVYVTGYNPNVPFGYDYVTIKYNSAGQKIWVAKYNGPGNGDDKPTALVVDANGNVYITGTCYVSNTDADYVTVKYNAAGVQQWLARYNGPDDLVDQANALAVDANGNVYITGWSYVKDPDTGIDKTDYATIKYNSAGTQQWVRRYNGPDNSFDGAIALAVDASGNVYVTGNSSTLLGGSTYSDYATIKYTSSGVQEWVVRYQNAANSDDRAAAIAVDASGEVYVTGTTWPSPGAFSGDYATVKYNALGAEQWRARYGDFANDEATALAVDQLGNVYVVGIATTGVGLENPDYIAFKYDAAGAQQWVARYDESRSSSDMTTALAVDAADNTYVTGFSQDSSNVFDYVMIKYNSTGDVQWLARYETGEATAIAVDNTGNVYVTGYNSGAINSHDYLTLKYDPNGTQLWLARFNSPANDLDNATAIAIDAQGNVYVTGKSAGQAPASGYDYATIIQRIWSGAMGRALCSARRDVSRASPACCC